MSFSSVRGFLIHANRLGLRLEVLHLDGRYDLAAAEALPQRRYERALTPEPNPKPKPQPNPQPNPNPNLNPNQVEGPTAQPALHLHVAAPGAG